MGLSSSQARLLNLTSRMHQIEYKAAKLEAEKLQMANESRQVYNEYQEALEQTKVQLKHLTSDGAVTFKDMESVNDMVAMGFAIVVHNTHMRQEALNNIKKENKNKIAVKSDFEQITEEGAYKGRYKLTADAISKNKEISGVSESDIQSMTVGENTVKTISKSVLETLIPESISFNNDDGKSESETEANNYIKLFKDNSITSDYVCKSDEELRIAINSLYQGTDLSINSSNFETVLTNLFNTGSISIVQKRKDGTGKFPLPTEKDYSDYLTSVATNTAFQEVADEKNLRKAEAKYEANMRQIDMKDRKFDYELAALDNERNAVKNEMETLKTVAKDNVDRTFKLFS